jgi:hypothetical protein
MLLHEDFCSFCLIVVIILNLFVEIMPTKTLKIIFFIIFQNDEAWNYYAGAAEMCALSQFMQGEALGKKYPAHYMEDSITKYLTVCQMPEFAIRASLFDALCLKYQGM